MSRRTTIKKTKTEPIKPKPVAKKKVIKKTVKKAIKKVVEKKVVKVIKRKKPVKPVKKVVKKEIEQIEPVVEVDSPIVYDENGKPYVIVNRYEEELQQRTKLVWLVVGFLALIAVIFTFWSIKKNFDLKNGQSLSDLGNQIGQTIESAQTRFNDMTTAIKGASEKLSQEQQLLELKNKVLAQIQTNEDMASWPEHSSDLLGLSLKYPEGWTQTEDNSGLKLQSFVAIDTPTIMASINVEKSTSTDLTLNGWLSNNAPIEHVIATSTLIIAEQSAIKYDFGQIGDNNIYYTVYIAKQNSIYTIKVYSQNGKDVYEPLLSKIISSIKLK
ncbi:MAG: hypothetical protein WCP18_03990 [bacterium]